MSLTGQDQVRQFYLGLAYPGHADIAAVKAGAARDLAVFAQDGSAVAADEKFMLFKRDAAGQVISSDIIDPKRIRYARSKAYVAPVLGSATVSNITANGNTLYTIELVIKQFGSFSPENEYVKKAFYKASNTDTAENIVDGLVASLARNFSREEPKRNSTFAYTDAAAVVQNYPENAYFTFAKTGTGAAAQLVITEKNDWLDECFDRDRRTRTHLDFHVNAKFTTLPTVVHVQSTPGVGDGYNVANMEFYLKGERNDFYRGAGYPHNFEGDYGAITTETYNFVEIGYYEVGRDEAKWSKKQLTIAMPDSAKAQMNALIGDLNTALGAGTVAVIP